MPSQNDAARDARAACETYLAFLALGGTVEDGPGVRVVSNPEAARCYDANHLQHVRAASDAECEAALAFGLARLGGARGNLVADPETPPQLLAELAHRGWQAQALLQMLLRGPLAGRVPPAVEIRRAETEADWAGYRALQRADHVETCAKQGRALWPERVSDEILAAKRSWARRARLWLACEGGAPCANVFAWEGENGVGIVEDLFTDETQRGRGLALALLHHAVADVRARGVRHVLIGARPDDTPKQLYAALGFRPLCLTWSWLAPE